MANRKRVRRVQGGSVEQDGSSETFFPESRPRVLHALVVGGPGHIGLPVVVAASFDSALYEEHPMADASTGVHRVEYVSKAWCEHRLRLVLQRIDEKLAELDGLFETHVMNEVAHECRLRVQEIVTESEKDNGNGKPRN